MSLGAVSQVGSDGDVERHFLRPRDQPQLEEEQGAEDQRCDGPRRTERGFDHLEVLRTPGRWDSQVSQGLFPAERQAAVDGRNLKLHSDRRTEFAPGVLDLAEDRRRIGQPRLKGHAADRLHAGEPFRASASSDRRPRTTNFSSGA